VAAAVGVGVVVGVGFAAGPAVAVALGVGVGTTATTTWLGDGWLLDPGLEGGSTGADGEGTGDEAAVPTGAGEPVGAFGGGLAVVGAALEGPAVVSMPATP
jgi:hypothetical protein